MRALALLWCALVAACGAVCGDGKAEGGEQCDDGNTVDGDGCSADCRAQETNDTFVQFASFIAEQFFDGFVETCSGLEIAQVEVTVTGPVTRTERVDCNFGQIKLSSLPAGTYVATALAFDGAGAAISRGLARADFAVGAGDLNVSIGWPFEDFTRSYSGTFFFRVLWGGADRCAEAVPAVTRQRLILARDGLPLGGVDGSATGPCRDGADSLSQAVVNLPWGPARFTVSGEDDTGRTLFQGSFDTFVGAGLSNPPMAVDVPSILPDAGPVDAPPEPTVDGGS